MDDWAVNALMGECCEADWLGRFAYEQYGDHDASSAAPLAQAYYALAVLLVTDLEAGAPETVAALESLLDSRSHAIAEAWIEADDPHEAAPDGVDR